jgi:hypothetical protein
VSEPEKTYPGAVTLAQVKKCVEDTMLELGSARVPEVLKSLGQMENVVQGVMREHETMYHQSPTPKPTTRIIGSGPDNPLLKQHGGEWRSAQATLLDPWAHRSAKMSCKTCMWYVRKTSKEGAIELGRCRRHAPTMSGYPAVFTTDWCGDHRLDENKA